jgi:hypothetical protein
MTVASNVYPFPGSHASSAQADLPLFDSEAERRLLYSIALDSDTLTPVLSHLDRGAFHHPDHALCFDALEAILSQHPTAGSVTPVTLHKTLIERGMNPNRARDLLHQVWASTSTSVEAVPLAKALAAMARRRAASCRAASAAEAAKAGRIEHAADLLAQAQEIASTGVWPDPIPLETTSLPVFPSGVLRGAVETYVEQLSAEMQTPRDRAAMLVLGAAATAGVGRFEIQPMPDNPRWVEPLNCFFVIAADSGEFKSPVFARALAPLQAFEAQERARLKPVLAADAEEREVFEQRLSHAKTLAAKTDDPAAMEDVRRLAALLSSRSKRALPKLYTSDATPESLASLMAAQGGRMGIVSPEGDGVFKMMAGLRYGKGEACADIYLNGFSGDPVRVNRKSGDEIDIARASLAVVITTQPSTLATLAKNGLDELGLPARFLYAVPPSRAGYRLGTTRPVKETVEQAYCDAIQRVLRIETREDEDGHVERHTLPCASDAAARFQEFRDAIEIRRREGGRLAKRSMRIWSAKLAGNTARLAGLLHLLDGCACNAPIGLEWIERAVSLAETYLIPHAEAAFSVMNAKSDVESARRLLAWIRDRKAATFHAREAHRALNRDGRRSDVLDPALEVLLSHGYLRAVDNQDAQRTFRPTRRPTELYRSHPSLLRA